MIGAHPFEAGAGAEPPQKQLEGVLRLTIG
jgi:hypothetical protein